MVQMHRLQGRQRGLRAESPQASRRRRTGSTSRRGDGSPTAGASQPSEPGPVEAGVEAEIGELAEARPGLAAVALVMARLMDNPRAVSGQPAAARVLVSLLDKLHSASARVVAAIWRWFAR
jgi:hypothetical protein